tara:strand:+ start:3345 stop:4220 length:876 start_codon:yes stop_codon:yes gene_type:complete
MIQSNFQKITFVIIISSIAIACGLTKNPKTENEILNVNESHESNLFIISTKFGDMKVMLSDETPLHRDNFKKLVSDSFYNETLFHRVIDGFMIQGGDPNSKNAKPGQQLGIGNFDYTIPSEFNSKLIHKRGALAAARQSDAVNPQKKSSGCQFYIVDGKKVNERALKSISKRKEIMKKRALGSQILEKPSNSRLKKDFLRVRQMGLKDSINFYGTIIQKQIDELFQGQEFIYTQEQIALYDSIGGTPSLDMEYTVFGEVIDGLNVIDSISTQQKDKMNRPYEDIKMTIKKL